MPRVSLPCEPASLRKHGLNAAYRSGRAAPSRISSEWYAASGHLGGAHEVEVLALDPVDVVGGLAEEAGALHRARLDQGRRDHLREAGVAGLVHRHHDQRELELRADAGEEVEAAARDLGAALEVDGAEHPAELDVVARLEVELRLGADRLDDAVVLLAAGRRLVGGDVRDLHQRRAPELLGLGLRGLGGLHPCGQLLGLLEQCGLLVALGLRDLLAERLLLAAQPLELGDRRAPRLVRGDRPVDHLVGQAALGLGGAHAVGFVTQEAGVDHGDEAIRAAYDVTLEIHTLGMRAPFRDPGMIRACSTALA